LVTCPYRGFRPRGLPSILEALGIGAEFIPSAFLAYYAFSVRMAFGSTIAIRRDLLEQTGGLEALTDLLADDFMLADRVRKAGREVHLSSYVVDDALGKEAMGTVWSRRLRWARTSRSLRPGPYWGVFITYTTPLALLYVLLSGLTSISLMTAAGSICLRIIIALVIARFATADSSLLRWGILTPLSDLFGMAVWVVSLMSRTVRWRGESFVVRRDGSLERQRTT
jgi:ceramide glucosyltransferase